MTRRCRNQRQHNFPDDNFSSVYLGDNCILKFSFGEVYRRIYGLKFSFTAARKRSCKT